MASSGNRKSCPRCGSPIREGDVYCSKCGSKLTSVKIPEEKLLDIKTDYWLRQARSSEKWGGVGFVFGVLFIVLYSWLPSILPGFVLSIWLLILGIFLVCAGVFLLALSFYINRKILKGQLPS